MRIGFFQGMGYPLRGAKFVYVEHVSLIRFWIIPVLLTGLALVLSLYGAFVYGPDLANSLWALPAPEGFWGKVLAGLHWGFRALVALLLFAVGTLFTVACSTVLAAPFNDALSKEVERLVQGGRGSEVQVSLLRDLGRTLVLEGVKLSLYCLIMVPLFVLGWVLPAVGHVVSSPLTILLTVLFLAIDYVDWPAARRDWPVRQRLALLRRFPGLMTGFGLTVWVMVFIPLVNLLFMPAAVAGGTLLFLDSFQDSPPDPGPDSPQDSK